MHSYMGSERNIFITDCNQFFHFNNFFFVFLIIPEYFSRNKCKGNLRGKVKRKFHYTTHGIDYYISSMALSINNFKTAAIRY